MGYASYPNPAFGYYRGLPEGPLAGGQGSNMGVKMQGLGFLSAGQGKPSNGAGWDPSIVYLFLLIIAEMIVFGIISLVLR